MFRDVAELIGEDAALAICRSWGGIELYVPKRLHADHALVAAIGMELARKLASEYGGSKISPPMMKASLKANIASARGSASEIARRFGVTRRYVSMVKNGGP